MLNLVWPLSRLVGVLWGRLLPPFLPSPLPSPGRGMRDLEGLSTENSRGSEAAPGDGENCPLWPHSLLSWPVSINCLFSASPACMHALQCLCYSSVSEHPSFSLSKVLTCCIRDGCLNNPTAESSICERCITDHHIVLFRDNFLIKQRTVDIFASTNRILGSAALLRHMNWLYRFCLFFSSQWDVLIIMRSQVWF